MPRTKSGSLPTYHLHRRTGQAVVMIDGRDFYLSFVSFAHRRVSGTDTLRRNQEYVSQKECDSRRRTQIIFQQMRPRIRLVFKEDFTRDPSE